MFSVWTTHETSGDKTRFGIFQKVYALRSLYEPSASSKGVNSLNIFYFPIFTWKRGRVTSSENIRYDPPPNDLPTFITPNTDRLSSVNTAKAWYCADNVRMIYERRSTISANVDDVRGNSRTTFVSFSDDVGFGEVYRLY